MKNNSLIKTNPYLRDPEVYEKLLTVNVASSSAIEIGSLPSALLRALKNKKAPKLIYPVDQK